MAQSQVYDHFDNLPALFNPKDSASWNNQSQAIIAQLPNRVSDPGSRKTKNAERPDLGYHLCVSHREMQLFCRQCSLAGVWAASLKQCSPVSLIKQWKENRAAALRTRTARPAQSTRTTVPASTRHRLRSRCASDALACFQYKNCTNSPSVTDVSVSSPVSTSRRCGNHVSAGCSPS